MPARPALPSSRALLGLVCLGALVLAGCGSSRSTTPASVSGPDRTWAPDEAEARLRAAADDWAGTPHELGGASQRGADCSGLVQAVFARQFEVRVPRTTEKQARAGTRVSREQLQPGDLVFFRPGWKKRHVGIYLSDGEFLHASSSSGVTVSPLDRSYWQDHWWQARRVLSSGENAPAASPPPSASDATAW